MSTPVSLQAQGLQECLPVQAGMAGVKKIQVVAKSVLEVKQQNLEEAKKVRTGVFRKTILNLGSEFTIVGGDIFSLGYMGMEVAAMICPAFAASPIGAAVMSGCGIAGGGINLFLGLICLGQTFKALKVKDFSKALYLFLIFLLQMFIGAVMLNPLGYLSFLTQFLVYAYLLSSLVTIGVDLRPGLTKFFGKKDLSHKMKLKELYNSAKTEKGLKSYIVDWKGELSKTFDFDKLLTEDQEEELQVQLNEIMNTCQAEIGVEAGIVLFEIAQIAYQIAKQVENGEKITEAQIQTLSSLLEEAQKKVKQWNISLFVRLFQQILYLIATPIAIYSQAISFGLMGMGTMIALYMDTSWKFRRNTPTVVPGCSKEGVAANIEKLLDEEFLDEISGKIKTVIQNNKIENESFLLNKIYMERYLAEEITSQDSEMIERLLQNVFIKIQRLNGDRDIFERKLSNERLQAFKEYYSSKDEYSLEKLVFLNYLLLKEKFKQYKEQEAFVSQQRSSELINEEAS